MMKRITDFLNLLVSIAKARWILLLGFATVLSILVWLRNKLFLVVEIRLPIIAIISFVVLGSYPVAKLFEWLLARKPISPVQYRGLLWKPSRLRFRYPTPLCPRCKCKIIFRVERKSMYLVQSIRDIENAQDKMIQYIYECPNHGILPVPNEPVDYLQELAQTKINNERENAT